MGGIFFKEGPTTTCSEDALSADVCQALLEAACSDAATRAGFEPLTAGFANLVWSVKKDDRLLVVKCYTDLVLLRIDAPAVGVIDVLASECQVGPHVHASNHLGIVMDFLPGRTLEEVDIHRGNFRLLEGIAKELQKLHRQSVPQASAGEPMLWRTMDKMMDAAKKRPDLLPKGIPSMEEIEKEIAAARAALAKHSPKIVCGHGDFKPSNVIEHEGDVRLIDFELGGPNYRGFDWMKLFRTADGYSEEDLRHFLRAYASCAEEPCSSDQDLEGLIRETRIFEPLTWLEAFTFFLALPQFKPEGLSKWHGLAEHRWQLYQHTKDRLL